MTRIIVSDLFDRMRDEGLLGEIALAVTPDGSEATHFAAAVQHGVRALRGWRVELTTAKPEVDHAARVVRLSAQSDAREQRSHLSAAIEEIIS